MKTSLSSDVFLYYKFCKLNIFLYLCTMIRIESKRIQGFGKGTEIGFPAINIFLTELPEGVSEGLWASKKYYNALSLISKFKDGFRIETHVFYKYENVNVGDFVLSR